MDSQLAAMNRQEKLTGDALVIGHQAYVGVHSIESDLKTGKPISIRIENVGRVPAFQIKVSVGMAALNPKHHIRQKPNIRWMIYVEAHQDFGTMQLLPGNFKLRVPLAPEAYFSKEEIALFVENSGVLSVRGCVEYHDGFEQGKQKTDFGFYYDYSDSVDEWIPHDPASSKPTLILLRGRYAP